MGWRAKVENRLGSLEYYRDRYDVDISSLRNRVADLERKMAGVGSWADQIKIQVIGSMVEPSSCDIMGPPIKVGGTWFGVVNSGGYDSLYNISTRKKLETWSNGANPYTTESSARMVEAKGTGYIIRWSTGGDFDLCTLDEDGTITKIRTIVNWTANDFFPFHIVFDGDDTIYYAYSNGDTSQGFIRKYVISTATDSAFATISSSCYRMYGMSIRPDLGRLFIARVKSSGGNIVFGYFDTTSASFTTLIDTSNAIYAGYYGLYRRRASYYNRKLYTHDAGISWDLYDHHGTDAVHYIIVDTESDPMKVIAFNEDDETVDFLDFSSDGSITERRSESFPLVRLRSDLQPYPAANFGPKIESWQGEWILWARNGTVYKFSVPTAREIV